MVYCKYKILRGGHMGKLIIPKHSADVQECMHALQVYYDESGTWVTNNDYKQKIKLLIGDGKDESAYTKKSQVPAYYGFIEWEEFGNVRSSRRITSNGIKFYEAYLINDTDTQTDLIINSLETVKFGRDNYGSCDSDSDIEPPNLKIRAILDLDYITIKEFACLLCLLADNNYSYIQGLNYIRNARKTGSLIEPIGMKSDYLDPKSILILERWNILESIGIVGKSKGYKISETINTNYYNRLIHLAIYNNLAASLASGIKDTIDDSLSIDDIEVLGELYFTDLDNLDDLTIDATLKGIINNRKPQKIKTKHGRRYKTDMRIIKAAISECGYKCFNDKSHLLFEKRNGLNYVEGHHIIPMAAQDDFVVNLDRTENVCALCPHCHKAIHYGNKVVVKQIIKKVFNDRKTELDLIGINITLDELIKKYY
jgi:hypothetical protein